MQTTIDLTDTSSEISNDDDSEYAPPRTVNIKTVRSRRDRVRTRKTTGSLPPPKPKNVIKIHLHH